MDHAELDRPINFSPPGRAYALTEAVLVHINIFKTIQHEYRLFTSTITRDSYEHSLKALLRPHARNHRSSARASHMCTFRPAHAHARSTRPVGSSGRWNRLHRGRRRRALPFAASPTAAASSSAEADLHRVATEPPAMNW